MASGTRRPLRAGAGPPVGPSLAVGGAPRLYRREQVILRSSDSGATWVRVESDGDERLYGVSVADDGVALAVGEDGIVLQSHDAGVTWQRLATDTEAWLAAVAVFGSGRVAVVGERGLRMRSSDAGNSWAYDRPPPAQPIQDVRFFEGGEGVAVGGGGTVLRTEDGGTTWSRIDTEISVDLNGFAPTGDSTGVAVGVESYVTEDRGRTWSKSRYDVNAPLSGVGFFDERIGIAVGDLPHAILRTEDGGRSWHDVRWPVELHRYVRGHHGGMLLTVDAVEAPPEVRVGPADHALRVVTAVEPVVGDVEVARPRKVGENTGPHILEAGVFDGEPLRPRDRLLTGPDGELRVAKRDALEIGVVGRHDVEEGEVA